MGVARALINWCDAKFKEALNEEDNRKANVKVFASGTVEGFIDAAIVMYVPVLITCLYYKNRSAGK